jgi:CHAD domain-containing protein
MAQPEFAEVEFPPQVRADFDCSWPLGVAAQVTVLRYFGEMLEQREHAWRAEEVEAVHKLRVAARRTRTALQTFSTLWSGKSEAVRHLKTLGDFAEAFNTARDLDVMIIYLREQLVKADPAKRQALEWLLLRNEELREKQRPLLHKALRRLEKQRVPEKFVAFFSRYPFDLWPEEDRRGGAPSPPADDRPSNDDDQSSGGWQGGPPTEDLNGSV